MNNKEKCITLLNAFDENQLESIAVLLQTVQKIMNTGPAITSLNTNVDTHKKVISIFKSAFSEGTENKKKIDAEIETYRKELETEKTSQTSLRLGSFKE